MILFDEVAETLDAAGIPFVLIGAAALAVHGVVRSTFDYDLLATTSSVLSEPFWTAVRRDALIDVRRGDDDDPFMGAVRFSAADERDVDLMVGRAGWLDGVLARKINVGLAGRDVPVAGAGDLILLKLYSGGTQDRWDIEQLAAAVSTATILTAVTTARIREDVESRLSDLPHEAAALWQQLMSASLF